MYLMPVIKRISSGNGFTHIENDCLRDINLDIQERGLLVTMLSLPDGWDFSGIGLASILPCGKSKVYSTLKKLEKAGYLRRTRITNDKGVVLDWKYEISGIPIFREERQEEFFNDKKVNTKPTYQKSESGSKEPLTENQEVDKKPLTENQKVDKNPLTDFPDVDEREVDNWKVAKNKLNNNQLNNNSTNQSYQDNNNININNTYRCDEMDSIDKIDRKEIKAELKKQLSYENLISRNEADEKQINSIINILADVMSSRSQSIRIGGENKPLEEVIQRFKQLTDKHIAYVLECLNKNANKPRNIRAYLLTSLFNAPSTMDCYYARDADQAETKQYSFDIEEIKSLANSFSGL